MRSAEYQRGFDEGYKEALRDALRDRQASDARRLKMPKVRLGRHLPDDIIA